MAIVPAQTAANAALAYAKAPQSIDAGLKTGDTQSSPFANLLNFQLSYPQCTVIA